MTCLYNMSTTTDFCKFGSLERRKVITLLLAWDNEGLPEDFYEDQVQFMLNLDSGHVFLVNSDCQIAMMNGDKLESFYSCPQCGQCGHEGFLAEIDRDATSDCGEWVEEIKKLNYEELP